MPGWGNSAGCWFVMKTYSPPTALSSISPASGSHLGGIFETRSRVFRRLVRWSPRVLIGRESKAEIKDFQNLRLLGKREMRQLFPGAQILEERFLGITKS